MDNKPKRVLIVAGEASGDKHAAGLVKDMLARDPELEFFGLGGPEMRAAGVNTLHDISELCLMGPYELITQGHRVIRIFKALVHQMQTEKPDLVILVDYSFMNLRFAKKAKRAGLKVFYYISPQLWAWRRYRVNTVRKYVDMMAVFMPFEVEFYQKHGVKAYYIGHPLPALVHPTLSMAEAKIKFGLDPHKRTIALLPGSRNFNFKRIMPRLMKTAELLNERHQDLQFVLPLASTLKKEVFEPYLQTCKAPIKLVSGDLYNLMICCDAAISVFGTVTLEIALLGVPSVLVYNTSIFSGLVLLALVRVPFYGLCNIVAEEEVAPELLQFAVNPQRITKEVEKYLDDPAHLAKTKAKLQTMKDKLVNNPQAYEAAELALNLMNKVQD